jgi:hypothetical protein
VTHQLAGFQDAPFIPHVGRLEQHAGLQDAQAVEFFGSVDQDPADQPHRVGRRAQELHLRRRIAVPLRSDDHVGWRLAAMQAVADIAEVVGEQVEEGIAVVEVADRRHGEEQRLDRQIEPGRGVERVGIGRRHRPRAMVGQVRQVAEAVQLLALRVGLVDRRLPARAVHLVDRKKIDRRPPRQLAQRRRTFLGARDRRR